MPSHTHRDLGPTRIRHSGPAAFTRSQRKKYPNMHPEGDVYMQHGYEKALRTHTKKYGKTGGTRRRHRKHRMTRRR